LQVIRKLKRDNLYQLPVPRPGVW